MANNNIVTIMLFNLALFVLIIGISESRELGIGIGPSRPKVAVCDKVIGAKAGDTCFDIANFFNLTAHSFAAINPNLNCKAIFVGEWLCVDGSLA